MLFSCEFIFLFLFFLSDVEIFKDRRKYSRVLLLPSISSEVPNEVQMRLYTDCLDRRSLHLVRSPALSFVFERPHHRRSARSDGLDARD